MSSTANSDTLDIPEALARAYAHWNAGEAAHAELGEFHRTYEKLMTHWREVLPPARFIEVDYEVVVAPELARFAA